MTVSAMVAVPVAEPVAATAAVAVAAAAAAAGPGIFRPVGDPKMTGDHGAAEALISAVSMLFWMMSKVSPKQPGQQEAQAMGS